MSAEQRSLLAVGATQKAALTVSATLCDAKASHAYRMAEERAHERARWFEDAARWEGLRDTLLQLERVSPALLLVSAERERQKTEEGMTEAHDDQHTDGSLACVAACYALPNAARRWSRSHLPGEPYFVPASWPTTWHPSWFKPTQDDRVRELVKAGALILAEIERLLRAEERALAMEAAEDAASAEVVS